MLVLMQISKNTAEIGDFAKPHDKFVAVAKIRAQKRP
jgi:hypothetical protein